MIDPIYRRWLAETVIVAGTGRSLTPDLARKCRGYRTIAVNDAYRVIPWADVVYACDTGWWDYHHEEIAETTKGELWSAHSPRSPKLATAELYGLRLVRMTDDPGFSYDQDHINCGMNSGFQAVNLAILFGAMRILLVGFDMHGSHFFGRHPPPIVRASGGSCQDFGRFIAHFSHAAKELPGYLDIVNCTPGSVLKCFRMSTIDQELRIAA